jgi:hypothetical protein
MNQVDIPEVVAELHEAFNTYEKALTSDDIETLNDLFWNDPRTLRYGTKASELLRSYEEIIEFRLRRGATGLKRTLQNVRITTFGRDFGVANTEYVSEGSERVGRQSQTWVRTDAGWKIASAHVSFGQ